MNRDVELEMIAAYRHERQAGRYSAYILLARAEMIRGDYAAVRKTLEAAERDIRNDAVMAQVRVQSGE